MRKTYTYPRHNSKGLVFSMPMNGAPTSGVLLHDESDSGFIGTMTNSPVASYPGFDFVAGSSMYIDIGTGPASVKTVSLWIKLDDISGDEFVIDMNGSDYLAVGSGVVTVIGFTAPTLYVNGVVGTSGVITIPALTWSHIAITDTTASNATDLDIGRVTGFYFDGLIADVLLYSRVLGADEIMSLYSIQKHKYQKLSA